MIEEKFKESSYLFIYVFILFIYSWVSWACQLYKKQARANSSHPITCTLTAKLIYGSIGVIIVKD